MTLLTELPCIFPSRLPHPPASYPYIVPGPRRRYWPELLLALATTKCLPSNGGRVLIRKLLLPPIFVVEQIVSTELQNSVRA